jgi:hypothetical protein
LAGTINQTSSPYTDTQGDQVGSTNPARDIWSATVSNDATNFYITLNLNPAATLGTVSFDYGIGLTNGSPTAGGDTSANATTHGNAYNRAISIDPSFGGMMDWIGFFPAGGAGTTASPWTSYGFNDYTFGTPGSTEPSGVWTRIENVASGEPMATQNGDTGLSSISLTVPMADFSSNLSLTPGTTVDFDIYSTGTSAGQTAYDSLADASATNATNSAIAQYNGTVLDSYTIQQPVPEPALVGVLGLSGLAILKRRHRAAS